MLDSRVHRKTRFLLLLLACWFAGASQARAVSMFDASAEAALTITGIVVTAVGDPVPLGSTGSAVVDGSGNFFFGGSTAAASASAEMNGDETDLGTGDGFSLAAMAQGMSVAGPSADAFALTTGTINLSNSSTVDTYGISFDLTYSLFASSDSSSPTGEPAFGLAIAELVDQFGSTLFYEEAFSDTVIAPGSSSFSAVHSFSVLLGPGESETLEVYADAVGGATSVPEPSTMLLFGAGCAGLLALRRRRARQ